MNFIPPPPVPAGVDVTRPHPARMYDYYLDGQDNWLSDTHPKPKDLKKIGMYAAVAAKS